jgi:hypothetical protein
MSLHPDWAGLVVPSKFFASLAVGKPVIFAGDPESDIALWIREHNLGLSFTPREVDTVARRLHSSLDKRAELELWSRNALRTYHKYFSKRVANERWNLLLRGDANSLGTSVDSHEPRTPALIQNPPPV